MQNFLAICTAETTTRWSITDLYEGQKAFDCRLSASYGADCRFALATGRRAREILDLEWNRVDLQRQTAWLDQTKNGTPRGVPLNRDAVAVLREQIGKHPRYCFTYRGKPIKANVSNKGWFAAVEKAGLEDFRFNDLRHTSASWHRQAGTSCDELKELGEWKTRSMVDRYAKFATEHLATAAKRIEAATTKNVIELSHFWHSEQMTKARPCGQALGIAGGSRGIEPRTRGFSAFDKWQPIARLTNRHENAEYSQQTTHPAIRTVQLLLQRPPLAMFDPP